jgi:hypothetical protein
MRKFKINKDIKIPGTNIILEKGDVITIKSLEEGMPKDYIPGTKKPFKNAAAKAMKYAKKYQVPDNFNNFDKRFGLIPGLAAKFKANGFEVETPEELSERTTFSITNKHGIKVFFQARDRKIFAWTMGINGDIDLGAVSSSLEEERDAYNDILELIEDMDSDDIEDPDDDDEDDYTFDQADDDIKHDIEKGYI